MFAALNLFEPRELEPGERQMEGAEVALAENSGGMMRGEYAVASVHRLLL